MENQRRFQDKQIVLEEFLGDGCLVVCSQCYSCAQIVSIDPTNGHLFSPKRMVCAACGCTKEWLGGPVSLGNKDNPVDSYFHFPLWLQARCGRHILWAYNLRHLEYIEAFVQASLRERGHREEHGWSNRSLFSRLPQWLKAAKNREKILQTIVLLKQSIPNNP